MTDWGALLAGMTLSPPATDGELQRLPARAPAELIELLRFANGARGDDLTTTLHLWNVETILDATLEYEDYAPAKGLLFVGSDGGREMIAYDTSVDPTRVLLVDITFEDRADSPWIEPSLADALRRIARDGWF